MNASMPKPKENVWLWLAKLVSGVLVFTLILVHIIVNHLVATGGLLNYAAVVAYLSKPWIAVMESSFLIVVVCHSLLGSRSILLDLKPSPRLLRGLDILFLLVGLVAIVYGIWLIRLIVTRG
jgi:succinate dehydrogenase / fumarate reductase membrane anchor subunit